MNEYIPDKWVVVKIEGGEFPLTYKVFGCWFGGYLGSNSWKMNSGIKYVSEGDNCYLFEGYSGSMYKCYKNNYGIHMYGQGVLEDIIERSKEHGVSIKTMSEDTNWLDLCYE